MYVKKGIFFILPQRPPIVKGIGPDIRGYQKYKLTPLAKKPNTYKKELSQV